MKKLVIIPSALALLAVYSNAGISAVNDSTSVLQAKIKPLEAELKKF